MADKRGCIVTVSPDRPIAAIRKDLTKNGFVVEHVLDAIGSITGFCEQKQMAKLSKISGVIAVAPSAEISVGPPDAPVS